MKWSKHFHCIHKTSYKLLPQTIFVILTFHQQHSTCVSKSTLIFSTSLVNLRRSISYNNCEISFVWSLNSQYLLQDWQKNWASLSCSIKCRIESFRLSLNNKSSPLCYASPSLSSSYLLSFLLLEHTPRQEQSLVYQHITNVIK